MKNVEHTPAMMAIALLALGSLAVIFGLWPSLFTKALEAFIEHIFH